MEAIRQADKRYSAGIRQKTAVESRSVNPHLKRYVWYPLGTLNFASTQATSPLFEHIIKRAVITKQESVDYWTKGDPDDTAEHPKDGQTLVREVHGTDAQINHLLTYQHQGMVYLRSMDGMDDVTASEIDGYIFGEEDKDFDGVGARYVTFKKNPDYDENDPNSVEYFPIERPQTLTALKSHLQKFLNPSYKSKDPELFTLVKPVVTDMLKGVETAIQWTTSFVRSLEVELQDARAGRDGTPNIDSHQEYYFKQLERPLPEDKAGVNMGDNLAKALSQLMGNNNTEDINKLREEMERMKTELEEKDEVIKQYESVE